MQPWLDLISPRLNTLWRGEWPAHFVEPARYLYDHELVLVMKGRFSLQVENSLLEMDAGSFAVIPPRTNHVSVAARGKVFRSCIHFDWLGCPDQRHPICSYFPKRPSSRLVVDAPPFVPRKHLVGRFDLKGSVPSLLDTIFLRWQNRDAFHRALCRGAFLEVLVQLLWEKPTSRQRQPHTAQLAYAAKERHDYHAEQGGSVQELLASLGRSYPHVSRLFHKSFGLTPVEYLNAQKLERAKMLLRNPNLGIAEVAYQSGFRDPGYFIKRFREQTGVTPGRYRSNLRAN